MNKNIYFLLHSILSSSSNYFSKFDSNTWISFEDFSKFDWSKCELPKLVIRHNLGLISAAKSWLLLLGQWRRLNRSNAGPTTAAVLDCLNWPTFCRNLAQYRPYTKPIVTFTMASSSVNRRARVRPMDVILLRHMLLLPQQTILKVRKPEFGTDLARCCAENKCSRPEFGPILASKCIRELSFQQRHDIGNRFSAKNFPMLGQCWAVSNRFGRNHLIEIGVVERLAYVSCRS